MGGLLSLNSEVLTLLTVAKWSPSPWSESNMQTWPKTPFSSPSAHLVLVLDTGLDLPVGHSRKMAREKDVICWEELGCTGKDLS